MVKCHEIAKNSFILNEFTFLFDISICLNCFVYFFSTLRCIICNKQSVEKEILNLEMCILTVKVLLFLDDGLCVHAFLTFASFLLKK